ncbi:MAG: universal stress protein [Thermoleophilaceae bacterium]|nr:universal stress protein [Thermoleophilaceae bacterium]
MGSIVLGYDASPGAKAALDCAIQLAREHGDELVIAHGVAPPGGVGEEWRANRAALEDQARELTKDALAEAEAAGVSACLELVDERPATALVDVADQREARYIVVGTWGESPLRGAILGSTPHKLLHIADRPVVVVPASR